MTDERLIQLALDGHEAAFCDLYKRYRDPLFRFAYRLTASPETAEDLVHDCFVALIRSPKRYESARASVRTYLYAAIRNLAHKHLRDSGRQQLVSESDDVPDANDVLERLLSDECGRAVQEAVMGLPVHYREVLLLAEYEDLRAGEIAEIVGTEEGAVRVRLHRARAALKKVFIERERRGCTKTIV